MSMGLQLRPQIGARLDSKLSFRLTSAPVPTGFSNPPHLGSMPLPGWISQRSVFKKWLKEFVLGQLETIQHVTPILAILFIGGAQCSAEIRSKLRLWQDWHSLRFCFRQVTL